MADDSDGQILTASFMDYAVPRARDLPEFAMAFREEPCRSNTGRVAALPANKRDFDRANTAWHRQYGHAGRESSNIAGWRFCNISLYF